VAALIKGQYGIESVLATGRAASFEVTYRNETVFSKIKEGRFPQASEVLATIGRLQAEPRSAEPSVRTTVTGTERRASEPSARPSPRGANR